MTYSMIIMQYDNKFTELSRFIPCGVRENEDEKI